MSKFRGPIAYMASNHVAANLLMAFFLVGGLVALSSIPVRVFPEITGELVTVDVVYPGASPEEVEEGVCLKIEDAIAEVDGIQRIRSVAREGAGTVIAELDEFADSSKVRDEIEAAVGRIVAFPQEAERPVITEVTNKMHVVTIMLSGDVPERTLRNLAEEIADDLVASTMVSQAVSAGTRKYEIAIEVSEDALRRWGLSFPQVAAAVQASSLDLPAGSIRARDGEILVRTKEQRYTGRDFERIVLMATPAGGELRLGDVATVVDGFEESDVSSTFDGLPCAMVRVFRVGKQGALEVAEAVKEYVDDLKKRLPAGLKVSLTEDRSEILASRIRLLLKNARAGLVLVFLALALFVDLRLAVWITAGIPVSFLGAMLVLPWFDVTINMVSLFAFIVTLGLVVDDAIVIGEGVYTRWEAGEPPLEASVDGTRELAKPVVFSVLTTLAAFVPLAFTVGRMGRIMRAIPVVVTAVLSVSLAEALFVLPSHLAAAAKWRVWRRVASIQAWVGARLKAFINGPFDKLVTASLAAPRTTLAAGVAALLVSVGLVAGGHVKFTFMPRVDSDFMLAELKMQPGTPAWKTWRAARRIEEAARRLEKKAGRRLIEHVSTTVGQQIRAAAVSSGGPHSSPVAVLTSANLAEVNVELVPSDERRISSSRLADMWREEVGRIPGAESVTFSSSLFSVGEDVNVELSHRDSRTLLKAVHDLEDALRRLEGVGDVADSYEPGKLELKVRLKPEGRELGLSALDLARQLRGAYWGLEVQRIQRGRDELKVKVRYPYAVRSSIASLDDLWLALPNNGGRVPLASVADLEWSRGYSVINRTDRRRVVTVTASVDPKLANANEINAYLRKEVLPDLVKRYPGLVWRFGGAMREQSRTMGSLLMNMLVALLVIYALLAIPLRSYVQPLIIMSAIPFGLVGAILGHMLLGHDLSMLSGMGIVALSGVVVNDSLILVDLANRLLGERGGDGVSVREVVRQAVKRRFRPIMLTTLTTFVGLMPMISETSVQARFLIPMAISLGFGVVFATAITLLLVPSMYVLYRRAGR